MIPRISSFVLAMALLAPSATSFAKAVDDPSDFNRTSRRPNIEVIQSYLKNKVDPNWRKRKKVEVEGLSKKIDMPNRRLEKSLREQQTKYQSIVLKRKLERMKQQYEEDSASGSSVAQ